MIHFDKLWVWTLEVFYDTPSSKYSWENFSQQVFTLDNGIDFKKRVKGLNYQKMTKNTIAQTQRVIDLKNILSQKLSSSDLNNYISAIEHILEAALARNAYKNASATIKKSTKDISQSRIYSVVQKQLTLISKEALKISKEVNEKVSFLGSQLGSTYTDATPNSEYMSEALNESAKNNVSKKSNTNGSKISKKSQNGNS